MQCSSLTQKVVTPEFYSDPQAATQTDMVNDPKFL